MADKNALMLELYAGSYASMAKMGDGTVNASDVAYDIRNNMIRQLIPAASKPIIPADDKPVICIGRHTIDQLIAGQTVEIEAAIMIPASDLTNAPLIAAAPELLEALKLAVSNQPKDDSCEAWVSDAKAAIAKATD